MHLQPNYMQSSMLQLTSELHEAIASHLQLEDLLNMCSTCVQLHRTINESNETWKNLYSMYFKADRQTDATDARHAFKTRYKGHALS